MHARLLHEESSSNPRILIARMPLNALLSRGPHVDNIAFRLRSGDLLLGNAGLAKPILEYLVYSKANLMWRKWLLRRRAFGSAIKLGNGRLCIKKHSASYCDAQSEA
jgi:hypothetical protein